MQLTTDSWNDLLDGLAGPQRRIVMSAIASSESEGWVATRPHVEIMAEFAAGTITARDYARRTLELLGHPSSPDRAYNGTRSARKPRQTSAMTSDDTASFMRGELDLDEWLGRAQARFGSGA